jgi:hypothetical protein
VGCTKREHVLSKYISKATGHATVFGVEDGKEKFICQAEGFRRRRRFLRHSKSDQ